MSQALKSIPLNGEIKIEIAYFKDNECREKRYTRSSVLPPDFGRFPNGDTDRSTGGFV